MGMLGSFRQSAIRGDVACVDRTYVGYSTQILEMYASLDRFVGFAAAAAASYT